MATPFQFSNGQSLSQSKAWFKFYFQVFFDKAKRNDEERRFDVYIYEKVKNKKGELENIHDYIDIEDFKRYWSPGFHIILVEIKQE